MKSRSPCTRADDTYAAGVTIWHLYMGHLEVLDLRIADGLRPVERQVTVAFPDRLGRANQSGTSQSDIRIAH